MLNEYLKLVDEAQKKRLKLTNDQIYQIKNMYNDISRDLIARARAAPEGSMNERWLRDFRRQFRSDISKLNDILEKNITGSMEQSAGYAANIQIEMFDHISSKLDISNSFSNMFTKVPTEVVGELVNGGFYKDGKSLSKRIWHNENKANGEFDYIIQKGLAEKRSIYDIASDLAKYVNPNVKNDWDFKKIYPGVGNKKIEYNSFRLAVTSIFHAYQLSLKRSCSANPFVEGIQWHTGNSHRNTCSQCRDRDGVIYKAADLPMDHPNGLCYFTPVIEKSMEDIGTELRNWINGGSNSRLDEYFPNVAADKSQKTKPESVKEVKKDEPINFNKMQEVFKAKRLGKVWPEVENKINASPEFMQKWYNKFQDKLQFDKTSDPKYAYYSPSTKGLTMHVKRDAAATNSKGACSTFFHEFGHLLDDASRKLEKINEKWILGNKPSSDPRFVNAIKEDYQDRLNMPLFKDKPQPFVEGKLTDLLRAEGDLGSGVQDIYSGLTLNRVRPKWGHDTKYWLRGNTDLEIASEAFAHMSSAFTNPERLKSMKEWFPKACDAFETIVNELLD